MKVLLYTDVHMSKTSSIIRGIGKDYSLRLENIIKSVNWAEDEAIARGCQAVICLGDFFDRPEASAQELTALRDIRWNNLPHMFIVGNHEADAASLKYSSTKALENNGFEVISKVVTKTIGNTQITFIPYMYEDIRKPLKEYQTDRDNTKKQIYLSHNDISGIQYGCFLTKDGFSIDEIEENCDLFLNGHIHNGQWLNKKKTILNLGNLTGKDANEDAFKYYHNVAILDTDTLEVELVENPYAFNFYKLEVNKPEDINLLDKTKDNAAIIVKCNDKYLEELGVHIATMFNVVASRVITTHEMVDLATGSVEEISIAGVDHLDQFRKFCLEHIGDTEIVRAELEEVTK